MGLAGNLNQLPVCQLSKLYTASIQQTHSLQKQIQTNASLSQLLSQLNQCISIHHLKQLHSKIFKSQFFDNVFLLTRLGHAYINHDDIHLAKRILTRSIRNPPIFLWNESIKGYARRGLFRDSIDLYHEMVKGGHKPNEFTFTFVLPACAGLKSKSDGQRVHDDVIARRCESNVFVVTALVDMYVKCGELGVARQMFDGMPKKETATYNAMIAGYVLHAGYDNALSLFNQMLESGIQADAMTMVSVLQACANLGALQQGRWVHEQLLRTRMEINMYLGAALINMYARCGSIEEAEKVFSKMPQRDLVTWTAVICGYGMHGLAKHAESLFLRMVDAGIRPDGVTFVGVLTGFSHKGMVQKGWQYFNKMSMEYHINPVLEHYSCMVDMLGRAGRLTEAENLLRNMVVKPDSSIWGGLLNACKIHRNVEIAERAFSEILKLDSNTAGWYVLMSNIYAVAAQWDQVAKMRRTMKQMKLAKEPGWSSIEVGGKVHTFLVRDQSHPKSEQIYGFLEDVKKRMALEGYVAETSCVLEKIDQESKEDMLCGHSERLAIAFGILNTEDGDVLRVMKNLRVCLDCHAVTKFISRMVNREIIVRDAKRFHHFKNGICSCGDYW